MCFRVEPTAENSSAKFAEQDIVCYKILDHHKEHGKTVYFAPFMFGHDYEKNKQNPRVNIEIKTEIYTGSNVIHKGYHSFKHKMKFAQFKKLTDGMLGDYIIAKFVIPVGALYYENETQYVSEEIIMKDVFKLKSSWFNFLLLFNE